MLVGGSRAKTSYDAYFESGHGDPSNDCTDNVCPAGQFVLKYDSCGGEYLYLAFGANETLIEDLGIGNCCPYNMQRLCE